MAIEDYVKAADIIIEPYSIRGANAGWLTKKDTGIRITHKPSGVSCSREGYRSAMTNKAEAWAGLLEKLAALPKPRLSLEHFPNSNFHRWKVSQMPAPFKTEYCWLWNEAHRIAHALNHQRSEKGI